MSKRRRSISPKRDKIPEPELCFPPIAEEESYPPQQFSSHWGKTLKDHIIQAGKKAPGFLFGVFTIDDLNHSATVVNGIIIPQFFIGAEYAPPMFRMSLQDVKDHNMWNFEGEWPMSVRRALWSTWDASLRSTVERAIQMSKGQCVSVVVLDTKRLGPNNVVLRETDKYLVEHEESEPFPGDGWYFIFGPILPHAFSMIPLAALATPVPHEELLNKLRQSNSGPSLALTDIFDTRENPLITDFDDELIMATKFGRLFDGHFALPVACMAIGCLARHPDLQIIWLEQDSHLRSLTASNFKDFAVPVSWLKDLSITLEKASLLAVPDARRGMRLLRDIVKCRRQPRQTKKAVADITSMLTRFNLGMQFGVLEGASCESSTFCIPGPSQPESEESEEEIDDVEDDLLKGSPIDDSMPPLQRQLLKAQSYTPRYLFRAWNNTDRISGGHPGLNTTTAITPRAFLQRSASATTSIYHIPESELRRMCITHLRTGKDPHFMTHFSSWAASIQVAFRFARGSPDTCYISIIDTKELRDSNAIMHEYLAHGIVSGSALKAVPLRAFKAAGIPTVAYDFTIPMRLYDAYQLGHWRAIEKSARITIAELEGAKQVASLYGEKFGTPVLLAILTLKQRSRDFWRSRYELESALPLFVEATKDFVVPAELYADASILTDIVHTTEYENVERMIRMLRELVNWRHGKGASGRKMVAPWKDVKVEEGDMEVP
ncbi:hypothetical protein Slin14017_G043720 [Septoria linicola]|nr:hypothetical protein Slin14017_G043720 [Septoria linicola]